MSVKERSERFNEVYKLLLGLLTVLVSFSAGFLREISFSLLFLYLVALIVWCLGMLWERGEFALKSLGFYWLVISLFSALYRLFLATEIIKQPVMAIMAIFSFAIFLLMLAYLSQYVGKKTKFLEIILVLLFTAIFIPTSW